MIDSMEIAATDFEEDPSNDDKRIKVVSKKNELRLHYESIEQDARQLSYTNWLQIGDRQPHNILW